jgi:hypothetical protein
MPLEAEGSFADFGISAMMFSPWLIKAACSRHSLLSPSAARFYSAGFSCDHLTFMQRPFACGAYFATFGHTCKSLSAIPFSGWTLLAHLTCDPSFLCVNGSVIFSVFHGTRETGSVFP